MNGTETFGGQTLDPYKVAKPSGYATQGDLNNLADSISAKLEAIAKPIHGISVAESNVVTSADIEKLIEALAKAQGEITNPTKDAENPHFGKSYADLAGGIAAIRAALSKHGIAYVQTVRGKGPLLVVYTRLWHSSGQWIETEWPAGPASAPPQQQGSALTYARRYSLFTIVGIAGEDDDDDGNAAQAPQAREQPTRGKQPVTSGRQKEPEPARPSLEPDASAMSLAVMLASLETCDTRQAIAGWSTKNAGEKERLLPDDREKLKTAFVAKQAAIKAPKAAEPAEQPVEQAEAA